MKRLLKKARTTSLTQLKPCQIYSVATAGPFLAVNKMQQSNIAKGTGLMNVDAPASAAIEWAFGDMAHPDLRNPMACIRAWLSVCDGIDMQTAAVAIAWSTRRAEIRKKLLSRMPRPITEEDLRRLERTLDSLLSPKPKTQPQTTTTKL